MKRKLNDSSIKNAKPKVNGQPLNLSDGGGLYLHIKTSGKVWRYNYRRLADAKMQTLTIGLINEALRAHIKQQGETLEATLRRIIREEMHKPDLPSAA